ncbi:MAG: NAD-dependent protein deacetylase [Pseudomonadota bacterium]
MRLVQSWLEALAAIDALLGRSVPPMVLTGAGCSTQAGIPAYRDRDGQWAHPRPVQFGEFRRSVQARRRYWARSFQGWPRFERAQPTVTHRALVALERGGFVGETVTQNVDRLHSQAGAKGVIDLHGRLDTVLCLECQERQSRAAIQDQLLALNPGADALSDGGASAVRPDGDRDVSAEAVAAFRYADCQRCGGILKPDVVFFGENVPAARAQAARERLATASGLFVVGSSLMVLSGYRFVREAVAAGKPVVVLTRGRTRADDDPITRIDLESGELLSAVVESCGIALPD